MVLKSIGHSASMRTRIDFETVRNAVVIENGVQLAGVADRRLQTIQLLGSDAKPPNCTMI